MPEQGGNDDKDLGLDWLAAQLTGDEDEPAAEPAAETAAKPDAEGTSAGDTDADARPDSAPTVALPVAPPAAPPADAPAAPPTPVAKRAAVPVPPAGSVPAVGDTAPAGTASAGTASADTAPGATAPAAPSSGGFLWGLTPTIEPDPAVDAGRRTPPAQAAPETPVIPAAAPPAAVTPAAPVPAAPVPAAPVPAAPVPAAPVPAADPEPTQPLTKTPAPPRRAPADLEAAPWWTTPAQSRLVPTAEEESAALGRRTPATPPSPLDTGVAPRTSAPSSATAPVSRHSDHVPRAQPAPAALPVSAVTAAAATGAATAVPGHDAHAAPAPAADDPGPRRGGPAGGWPPRRPARRDLVWAGRIVVAVLVIIGLFFLGQSLGDAPVAAPTESAPTEPAASTPTTAPEPVTGPQPAGVHAWNTLFGTECLEPYTSPWDEEFTVVDCATPHTGQLVYRGTLEGEIGSPFPGEQAFADQINVLCSAPGVIDFEAAGSYADVQLQGSYPVTAEQWDAGERYFYCFASRSSGEPLTASLSPAA